MYDFEIFNCPYYNRIVNVVGIVWCQIELDKYFSEYDPVFMINILLLILKTFMDRIQILLLMSSEMKQINLSSIPPGIVRKLQVFWWFQGEQKLTSLLDSPNSRSETFQSSSYYYRNCMQQQLRKFRPWKTKIIDFKFSFIRNFLTFTCKS